MAKEFQEDTSLSVGEVAKRSGVSPDTIRHYEKLGLIPRATRQRNGYRRYATSTLERIQTVRAALTLGFTLKELSLVFKTRDTGGAPCRQVRALAETKLTEAKQRIEEMTALRNRLEALLNDWDQRLAQTSPGERAGLLDLLSPSTQLAPKPTAKPLMQRKVR